MYRLLINRQDGDQVIEVVRTGGRYNDQSAVIWDERTDGPLPAITLGGMVRSGNTLSFDQIRKDQHDASISLIVQKQENEKANIELMNIDMRTIAVLREIEAAKPSALNVIKDLEIEAAVIRSRIK